VHRRSLGWMGALAACEPSMEFLDRRVEAITDSSARIRFETSRAASCAVEFGRSPDLLDGYAEDPTMDVDNPYSIDHDVPLFGLAPDTTYHWRAVVVDPGGRAYTSDVLAFDTLMTEDLRANVATLATVAGVSSNFGGAANDATWGADAAIDGDPSTEWASNGDGDDAWIEVEWEEPVTLSAVRVWTREMADGTSVVTSFTLSDGAATWGPFPLDGHDAPTTVELESAITVEALRFEVEASTGGNTGLRDWALLTP
jgi:hypothetical protein